MTSLENIVVTLQVTQPVKRVLVDDVFLIYDNAKRATNVQSNLQLSSFTHRSLKNEFCVIIPEGEPQLIG